MDVVETENRQKRYADTIKRSGTPSGNLVRLVALFDSVPPSLRAVDLMQLVRHYGYAIAKRENVAYFGGPQTGEWPNLADAPTTMVGVAADFDAYMHENWSHTSKDSPSYSAAKIGFIEGFERGVNEWK